MKITVSFNTDSDAFHENDGETFDVAVREIMRDATSRLYHALPNAHARPDPVPLRDWNGNTVGRITFGPSDEDS